MSLASCINANDNVFTFLSGLSNRMIATPVGVTSTFWKNLYLRSGVGANDVDTSSSLTGAGAGCSSFTAAAAVENE